MENDCKIITNNHWRPFLYGFELPEKWRKEFDYLNDDEYLDNTFIFYRGNYESLPEFMCIDKTVASHPRRKNWKNWHGYKSDSFFSGKLIRLSECGGYYQIATYIC